MLTICQSLCHGGKNAIMAAETVNFAGFCGARRFLA
jgi:hypothetical protein